MRYRSIFLTAVAAVGILWSGSAQEHKRVEVTTIYNPEIATAEKLAAPASIDDTPVKKPLYLMVSLTLSFFFTSSG